MKPILNVIGFVAILVAVIELVSLFSSFLMAGEVNWIHLPIMIGGFVIFLICAALNRNTNPQ